MQNHNTRASYVYPVRSLLAGHIHPAGSSGRHTPPTPPDNIHGFFNESGKFHQSTSPSRSGGPSTSSREVFESRQNVTQSTIIARRESTSIVARQRASSTSEIQPRPPVQAEPAASAPSSSSKQRPQKTPRTGSPNFRHFPADDNPYFPHTSASPSSDFTLASDPDSHDQLTSFPPSQGDRNLTQLHVHPCVSAYPSTALPIVAGAALAVSSPTLLPPHFIASQLTPCSPHPPTSTAQTTTAEKILVDLPANTVDKPSSADPSGISQLCFAHDPFVTPTAAYPNKISLTQPAVDVTGVEEVNMPFNPSEYGLVHLPPLPPSRPNGERPPSVTAPGYRSGKPGGRPNNNGNIRWQSRASNLSNEEQKSHSSPDSGAVSSTQIGANTGSGSSTDSDELHATVQFRYAQDENENHIVVGREGKLQRCEDEPIRTPGAVQGFGVLIGVDEMEDTLVVRQVSENSTELLGLSPRYLFDLECFTDTLPESQVAVLWDNIQFLTEPDLTIEDEDNSPHVFLLTGFGAPGSASHDGSDMDSKRSWTCWCAVHRAQGFSSSTSVSSGLIVMEFELERDLLNPLYPPVIPESVSPPGPVPPTASQEWSTGNSEGTVHEKSRRLSTSPDSGFGSGPGQSRSSNIFGSHECESIFVSRSTESLTGRGKGSTPVAGGLEGSEDWLPSVEDVYASTACQAKPIPALERLRRMTCSSAPYGTSSANTPRNRRGRRTGQTNAAVGVMDIFAVMAQLNEQLGAAPDLDTFLNVVVGVVKDLTQFHRVLIYQFDEMWNGQVVAELLDWSQSHDLFKGLHFPAGDIPAQARALYAINKVRLLYNRGQPTARIIVRNKDDLEIPLDMTHCYLRAMSPIHIQYLENMGVRASMSVSIMAFGQLWGLVTCHSYGPSGMRVSFPVRQMLRLLSQSISRNIERLSYAQRLHTRKLINTLSSDHHPTGYIVSNADDLLGLFDADFGILVVGEGAKILGPNQHGQEILIIAEYLRLKKFDSIQASQAVINDFPDLQLTTGFDVMAGLLYVPLSSGGKDFIAFLRRGQLREVRWAGKPYKDGQGTNAKLEPRKSFKIWAETVAGRCRVWTDEQLETAGVLALVYGKFIEVWREKENVLQTHKLANLLLSNASHEVRTPLNHIINYLELAMNGPLDAETRDNLSRSHAASKSLLFTINDLLDLTRLESGNETSFNEPFDLHFAIEEATHLYRNEAQRRDLKFSLDLSDIPTLVVGDAKKIRTVVQNLTANALKYTSSGAITVRCTTFVELEGLRSVNQTAVEIIVSDSGCGISGDKLENIFREFEQVQSSGPKFNSEAGVGLGLAVVARIVEQLGGQLRVESKVGEGSQFSFLIPLALSPRADSARSGSSSRSSGRSSRASHPTSLFSNDNEQSVEDLVQALSSNHMSSSIESLRTSDGSSTGGQAGSPSRRQAGTGFFPVTDSPIPVRPIKVEGIEQPAAGSSDSPRAATCNLSILTPSSTNPLERGSGKLRILIVEDNDINRAILAKRLTMSGHVVVNTTNGQEGSDIVEVDQSFDAVFMDIQMPILNGLEATQQIRAIEEHCNKQRSSSPKRLSHLLNGRIPILAVSASLVEQQRDELSDHGVDGWILKPIDFKRLNIILKGVTDPAQRQKDVYRRGCNWEAGGWLQERPDT